MTLRVIGNKMKLTHLFCAILELFKILHSATYYNTTKCIFVLIIIQIFILKEIIFKAN